MELHPSRLSRQAIYMSVSKDWNGKKLAAAVERLLEELRKGVESSIGGVQEPLDFVTFGGSH